MVKRLLSVEPVPVTERPIDHQHDNDYVPDEYEDEYDENGR